MRRNSNRLKDYDYTQNGAYFVTICTNDHQNHLGDVINENVYISTTGKIVTEWWQKIPEHFTGVILDEFIVMPNHIHGIIFILNGSEISANKPASLGSIIAYYKYQCTKSINSARNTSGMKFWQRGYYDHIIRNDISLNRIREYIRYNHLKWNTDRENLLYSIKNNTLNSGEETSPLQKP